MRDRNFMEVIVPVFLAVYAGLYILVLYPDTKAYIYDICNRGIIGVVNFQF
jgi:hypothetical protein